MRLLLRTILEGTLWFAGVVLIVACCLGCIWLVETVIDWIWGTS